MNLKNTPILNSQFANSIVRKVAVILTLCFCFNIASAWSYDVVFEGIENTEILNLVRSASQLEKLKDSPPTTLLGLKRRAEGDMNNILQALHSQAYYGAVSNFEAAQDRSQVKISIQLGPVYPLTAFNIRYMQNGEELSDCPLDNPLRLKDIDIHIGEPALPETILSAEDNLLDQLNLQGFAFASIKARDVYADEEAKNVIVWIVVETGPKTYFGPLTITGADRLKDSFFNKKLHWCKGSVYDPMAIEKTQEALELSGLFRSVNIMHSESPVNGNLTPIEIAVVENKQRSIGFGLKYTTSLGPGFSTEWEDRNIFGEGQKLSFRSNIWRKLQNGTLSYLIPDFQRQNQNLIWTLDYEHERTKSFTENSFSLSGLIERKLSDRLQVSYGGMYKRLRSQRSDFNGTFDLFKIPLQLRWSNVDNILEPTKGGIIQLKSIPSFQMFHPRFSYCINTMTGTLYQSLTDDNRHVFAAKLILGSIFGASKNEIPPPERFYAGSDSTLRGYRFMTVSPIGKHHKPLGGRSMFIYSMELRNRIGKDFGLVFFYDVGNVFSDPYPNFKKEGVRQSAGLGIRYYTSIGPLRLDIAFPLNKRRHIDHSVEAYFSIGQSF